MLCTSTCNHTNSPQKLHQLTKNNPSGENRASNAVFAIVKLLIFITKMLKISRGKSGCFTCCFAICREFCFQKVRDSFSLFQVAMRFCNMRPVFSKRFSLEFSQRHFQTLMLHISFGLTWLLTLVARLHGMADFDSLHIASTPPV